MTPRRCAWVTLVGALALSVAAQLAYACMHAGPSGPSVGRLVGSTSWPILTLLAVEIAVRTPWPTAWVWQLIRWVGVGGVGAVAAIVSYAHMSGLLRAYDEPEIVAALGPLAVDGLLLTAAAALVACERDANAPEPTAPSVSAPAPTIESAVPPVAGEGLSPVAAERIAQVTAAIKAGEIEPKPTADAIRARWRGAAKIARQVRDAVADVTPDSSPEHADSAYQTI